MTTGFGSKRKVLASILVLALALAACGSDGGSSSDEGSGGSELPNRSGLVGVDDDPGDPVQGGVLDIAVWFDPSSLDPALGSVAGVTTGSALIAIYDVLMRYDAETDSFEPQLAESLEPSDDAKTWTLKLREGVEFSDGTPVDADAVIYNLDRSVELESPTATRLISLIESTEAVDDLTVVFELARPWQRFPYILSMAPGLLVSPTAAERLGDGFEEAPVGAGAFTVERFAEGEELVLTARDDYWAGRPPLDGLRFVPVAGERARLDGLNAGQYEMAFFRNPEVVSEALAEGYVGYIEIANLGELLVLNNRAQRATEDVLVRQAIAHAVNPDDLNRRVSNGSGAWSTALYPSSSLWDTSGSALGYDVDEARSLLDQAKASGYDGTLTLSCDNSPERQNQALTLEAQLEAVGFDVTIDRLAGIGDLITKVQMDHDYELACYGNNNSDAEPWIAMDDFFNAPTDTLGFEDEEMLALVDELAAATDDEATQDVIDRIQARWNETMPSVPLAAVREFDAWVPNLHGVLPTATAMVILSGAWLAP
jgi:peptide/nickel transport system substrate-binding protein